MAKPFFITGLPRSRTAWLSVLFCHRDSFCFHELSARVGCSREMRAVFERAPYTFAGTSDSFLLTAAPDFRETFPDAPVLVVRRNPAQVLKSYRKLTGGDFTKEARVLLERLEDLLGRPGVKAVDFDDLSDEVAMRECWAHCLPGHPFDLTRFREMAALNVQIDLDGDFYRRVSGSSSLFFGDVEAPNYTI